MDEQQYVVHESQVLIHYSTRLLNMIRVRFGLFAIVEYGLITITIHIRN
jgi:hypothetical protein